MSSSDCDCATCTAFDMPPRTVWAGAFGVCDLCRCEHLSLVSFIPEVVKGFLRVERLCWGCKNTINFSVQREMRLCWGGSTDEELRWGLARACVDIFHNHFYKCKFIPRKCCEYGHGKSNEMPLRLPRRNTRQPVLNLFDYPRPTAT